MKIKVVEPITLPYVEDKNIQMVLEKEKEYDVLVETEETLYIAYPKSNATMWFELRKDNPNYIVTDETKPVNEFNYEFKDNGYHLYIPFKYHVDILDGLGKALDKLLVERENMLSSIRVFQNEQSFNVETKDRLISDKHFSIMKGDRKIAILTSLLESIQDI